MTTKAAIAGAVLAVCLALLWFAVVLGGFTWVSSSSILVDFTVTVLSVTAEEGTIPGLVKLTGKMLRPHKRLFKGYFGRTFWLEEVRDTFCAGIGRTLNWCDMWEAVIYSSYFMVFSSIACGLLLIVGGVAMCRYGKPGSSDASRSVAFSCLLGGPVIALVGLLQYSLFTKDFGEMKAVDMGPLQAQSMYGLGYLIAWVLCLFSWIPLTTLVLFVRRPEESAPVMAEPKQANYMTMAAVPPSAPPPPMVKGEDFGVTVVTGPMTTGPVMKAGAPEMVVAGPPMMVSTTPVVMETVVMAPTSGPTMMVVEQTGPMPMSTGAGPQIQQAGPGFGAAAW